MRYNELKRGVPVWRPSFWALALGAITWGAIGAALLLALRIATRN